MKFNAKIRESQIEKAVKKYAKENGFLVYPFKTLGNRGLPDDMFLYGGKIVFIEFKRPGQTLRALQKSKHKEMQDKGAHVYVIDDIETGKKLIDSITYEIDMPF